LRPISQKVATGKIGKGMQIDPKELELALTRITTELKVIDD
jgi:hypothetical protein